METAISMMRDHIQRRSRASSPNREEARQLWYSAPPGLQIYDREVINVLLNLAKSHLSSTFAIFSTFEAITGMKEELCLAMASVGGLFCTVQGSTKIAKKLYNDARRLLLESVMQISPPSFSTSLSSAKTFILLEIYGICSGDKRSYEFVEAFHANTLQAITSCRSSPFEDPHDDQGQQLLLLSEAMHVLESYRVLLLLRPPSFAPEYHPNLEATRDLQVQQGLSRSGLWPLMSPGNLKDVAASDLKNLTAISAYSWMSSPQGLENLPHQQLWKAEFVELALDRWIQAKTLSSEPVEHPDISQLVLYHLTHINLHSNLRTLQRFTQEFMTSLRTSSRGEISDSIRRWTAGSHFKVAHWHAETILRLVKEAVAPRRRHQSQTERMRFLEPPHLPYCVYFAALIVWYGALAISGQQSFGDACIDASTQLLFALKVRVSKQLGEALCDLLSDEGRDGK